MSLFFIFKFLYFAEICYRANFITLNDSTDPKSQVCPTNILVFWNIIVYYHNS